MKMEPTSTQSSAGSHPQKTAMAGPTMGPVPGSEVENTLSTDSLLLGFRVSF